MARIAHLLGQGCNGYRDLAQRKKPVEHAVEQRHRLQRRRPGQLQQRQYTANWWTQGNNPSTSSGGDNADGCNVSLTIAPGTGTDAQFIADVAAERAKGIWGAYIPIINTLRSELTVLHPQYYNNGDIYTPYATGAIKAGSADQLVATARMLIDGFNYGGNTFAGLRPGQVGFGVPSGRSSAGSGFTTNADVSNALNCLTRLLNCGTIKPLQAYPDFRGVMTWSMNWDRHDNYNFSVPSKNVLKTLP